jgi:hypothetical protein
MAIQIQGNGGVVQEVGGTAFRAGHAHIKPVEYGALGHYRTSVRIVSTATQAANSRIMTLRNTHATNILILTRLTLRAIQIAAGTLQENSLDVYRVTGFTVDDTTNTVTPTAAVKRSGAMAAYPGGASVRYLTTTGVAAGMTGGTMTKDAQFFATFPYMVTAGLATATYQPPQWGPLDCLDDVNGTHPFALTQNQGIVIENRVLNVTSMGIAWYLDFSWAEVTAY